MNPAPLPSFSAASSAGFLPNHSGRATAWLAAHWHATWRGLAAFIVIAAALIAAEPSVASIAIGAILSALGEAVRIVAAGYGYKLGDLSLDGPYRFVRHPYFLGSALLNLGLCVASRNAVVVAGATVLLAAAYAGAIKADEERRKAALGPTFATYRANVPAILPKLIPSPVAAAQRRQFSLGLAVFTGRHREFEALVGLAIAFGFFYAALRLAAFRPYFRWSTLIAVGVYAIGRFIYYGLLKRRRV